MSKPLPPLTWRDIDRDEGLSDEPTEPHSFQLGLEPQEEGRYALVCGMDLVDTMAFLLERIAEIHTGSEPIARQLIVALTAAGIAFVPTAGRRRELRRVEQQMADMLDMAVQRIETGQGSGYDAESYVDWTEAW